MNKKNLLLFSIVCLMLFTISYTYSVFSNKIVGNISATSGDWRFVFNVTGGTVENDYYKLSLSGTSGSFNVVLDSTGYSDYISYSIKLDESNLSNDVKFYRNSSYTNEISDNVYSGNLDMNTTSNITIYWKSDSSVSGNLFIRSEGTINNKAMMKNGYSNLTDDNGGTEFWNDTYRPYIRTVKFDSNLSNLPSSCTGDSDLCWDLSYYAAQEKKVYGYLIDSGIDYTDSDSVSHDLYNLYIVSVDQIYAPIDCGSLFYEFTNLISVDFNDSFNTTDVTIMSMMFGECSSLTILDLSSFNTSNVTLFSGMFISCSSLTGVDLSSFYTPNLIDTANMFNGCSSLTSLDISTFDTSKVTRMWAMFLNCSSLTNLDLGNFNTSSVTNMRSMFGGCSSLTTTINIMNAGVTNYRNMFMSAATNTGAQITVNYISDASSLVDSMIATKSSTSNVVKGSVIS